MKHKNEISVLIKNLNPPKRNAEPKTWRAFYSAKGFAVIPSTDLLSFLEECLDALLTLQVEAEFDEELEDLELEKTLTSDFIHTFRILVSVADSSARIEAVDRLLLGWDFARSPELSDDLSGAVLISSEGLVAILEDHLENVLGNAETNIVRSNAIVTALGHCGEACRKYIWNIIEKFDEWHPEVVLVSFLTGMNDPLSFDQAIKLKNILDVNYFSSLGVPVEQLERRLGAIDGIRARSVFKEKDWLVSRGDFSSDSGDNGFRSLVKTLRWFGVQGRWEDLYIAFLSRYLSTNSVSMAEFLEDILTDEDAAPLPQYSSVFLDFCNSKASAVERTFLQEIPRTIEYLNLSDIKDAKARVRVLAMIFESFLFAFEEDNIFAGNNFLKSLRYFLSQVECHFPVGTLDLMSSTESSEASAMALKLETDIFSIWRREFDEFTAFALDNNSKERSRTKKAIKFSEYFR